MMQLTKTTCPYCGVGCGVIASRSDTGEVTVAGDPDHPANFGKLCSKGSALAETLSLDDRLLFPEIHGERASWNAATTLVAKTLSETVAKHGPDSVAFYVSGQLLTEDYYVANKLMKGFIGSANIDTNSRLCMASSVAGHKRAFGADVVPGNYEDLELADLVVLTGSNFAWCHPVLFQRLLSAKEKRGTKIIVIDPRKTATAEFADLHLPINLGSDVALFNGLLRYLNDHGKSDPLYILNHTNGVAEALDAANDLNTSKTTGLEQSQLEQFYSLFAATERTVTVWSQGVNQSSSGTDKVNSIINCHLITGRIGKPGMGPFSITGQPNAMGGREVGGLANMLAAHMEIENPKHRELVQRFWASPKIAQKSGLKAVDMFDAIKDGRIKAIWIMATNPAVSMPNANLVCEALKACPFVIVSEAVSNSDTAKLAHVLLPAAAWGEKDGTVTNSERRISRQRSFLQEPGEARADWQIICDVARFMDYSGFDFETPAEIFREHAALTKFENHGTRAIDLGDVVEEDYESLKPFQWARRRMFADGGFFTESGRANFIATPYRAPKTQPSKHLPLVLNTGRIRDQWHTMTRTGKSARLMAHLGEPFVEIHPEDARSLAIEPATLVNISSQLGEVTLRASITDNQKKGSVFASMHWSNMNASNGRVVSLLDAKVDPISGQPELKFGPVSATPFPARWYGFAVTTQKRNLVGLDYWAEARANNGFRYEIADSKPQANWLAFAQTLLGAEELHSYVDDRSGTYRFAVFDKASLIGALFVAREPVAVSRNWVVDQLGKPTGIQVLAGCGGASVKDHGPVVCACNNVGKNSIVDAISNGASSLNKIGDTTRAGTSCGSCRPEIQSMLNKTCLQVAKSF
jgi:assimilatory nitrate reductase catalytic subunit